MSFLQVGMVRLKGAVAGAVLAAAFSAAQAQSSFPTPNPNVNAPGFVEMCMSPNSATPPTAIPCDTLQPRIVKPAPGSQVAAFPQPYPQGASPVTASGTGSTGAISASLPAAAGKFTYICGFAYQGSDATAAVASNIAVTGTISGTMNFGYVALAAGATVSQPPPTIVKFSPCVPSSAVNTAIVVTPPTLGTGATIATVSAWGYQL